ncbi:MAG: hypothetical protein K940chlam6_00864 [Chlamydiae bacterium]|nr:hypothetical protein [Chlamydiota bacterium]
MMGGLFDTLAKGAKLFAEATEKGIREFDQEVSSVNKGTLFFNVITISAIATTALAFITASFGYLFASGLLVIVRFHIAETLNSKVNVLHNILKAIGVEKSFIGGDSCFFLFRRPISINASSSF